LTKKRYNEIKNIFLSKIRNLIIYVPPEDFIQECFAGLYAKGGEVTPRVIKKAVLYARRHTEPVLYKRKYMYEIPIGIPEGYIHNPRVFSSEWGDV